MRMVPGLIGLAGLGLILSIAVQISAIREVDPSTWFPGYFLLHIGLFVVGIPAGILSKTLPHTYVHGRMQPQVFRHFPRWMKCLTVVVFGCAAINFLALQSGPIGTVEVQNGRQVLVNHGHVVKLLTPAEARMAAMATPRIFSGHWIVLYWIFICTLYAAIWKPGCNYAKHPHPLHPHMMRSAAR